MQDAVLFLDKSLGLDIRFHIQILNENGSGKIDKN